jgi:hypothetical protein
LTKVGAKGANSYEKSTLASFSKIPIKQLNYFYRHVNENSMKKKSGIQSDILIHSFILESLELFSFAPTVVI